MKREICADQLNLQSQFDERFYQVFQAGGFFDSWAGMGIDPSY